MGLNASALSELQLIHYGVKGMQWGVRKQAYKLHERQVHGKELNKKPHAAARSVIRNGSAWTAAQLAIFGATTGVAALIGPAGLAVGTPAAMAMVSGAQLAQLISTSVAGGKTVSELRAISADNKVQAYNKKARSLQKSEDARKAAREKAAGG